MGDNGHVVSLRHSLLGLIAAKPTTGYELAKLFQASLANVWSAQLSQIYPELNRLLDADLIRVVETGPRGRKTYEITDAGREDVRRWLVETEPDRASRNSALLRTFFLWLVEPAEAEAYLRREAAYHRERLRAFEEVADANEPVTPSSRLPLDWAIRYCRELAAWSEWAADQVRAEAKQHVGSRAGV